MKKIFQIFLTATSLSILLACGDKADIEQSIVPASGAKVKFYHLAPDAPGIEIYVNDKKLSGVLTVPPAAANLVTYGGTFPVQDYAAITGGSTKVKVIAPATANTPEIQALSAELPFDANKFYSLYAYGTSPAYGALVLNDDFTAPDAKKAYIRFINLVNPTATATSPTYDLVVNGNTVFSNVGYKGSNAAFTAIDAIPFASTALVVQAKVGTTLTTLTNGIRPYAGRFYTIIISGIVGGTAAKAPTVYLSINK
jgi:hypothetical protein